LVNVSRQPRDMFDLEPFRFATARVDLA
jgi:hypothetical protein